MTWQGKEVLVTGAGGFIASHLVEALVQRGASVRAMVHYNSRNDTGNLSLLSGEQLRNVRVISGDVQDAGCVREAVEGCDCVFHLAALIGIPYSYRAPHSYLATNVYGTLNVLEAVRHLGIARMVHTSTSEAYGTAIRVPIDEDHPLQGQSPYSASKIAADKFAESYHLSFGAAVATLRPFNTYGPRQSARAIVPTVISQLLAGKKTIELGSLAPQRDLTFVTDTAEAFIAIAECDEAVGKVVNAGSGKTISIGELAKMLVEEINPKAKIVSSPERVRPQASEVMKLLCDNTRAKQMLGWEPKV